MFESVTGQVMHQCKRNFGADHCIRQER